MELRNRYLARLEEGEKTLEKNAVRNQAARFVQGVAQELAKNKEFGPEKVWKALSKTDLEKDIASMKSEADVAQEKVEDAALELCDYLRDLSFLQHLHDHHRTWLIDASAASEYYDISYADGYYGPEGELPEYEEGHPYLRQIDHTLAILTEKLHLSKHGTKLLEDLLDETKFGAESTMGFGDLWVETTWKVRDKIPKITQPLGLFFFNLAQRTLAKVERAIAEAKYATVNDILADPDIARHLKSLSDRFGLDLRAKLTASASEYKKDWEEAAKGAKSLHTAVKAYSKTARARVASLQQKGESACFALAVSLFSFTLSTIELIREIEAGDRDPKSLLPFLRDSLRGSRDIFTVAGGVKARIRQIPRAEQIMEVGKLAGAAAGMISFYFALRELKNAQDQGQWDQVWCYGAYAGLELSGVVVGLLCTGPWGWVIAAAAVGVAFLTSYLADPEIIVWMELTPWGNARTAKGALVAEDVIDQYFDRLCPLSVKIPDESDRVEVSCNVLSEDTPVSITLKSKNPPKEHPPQSFCPGVGAAFKMGSWEGNPPDKKMEIRDISKIWTDLRHDGETEYTACAETTPYEGAKLSRESSAAVLIPAHIVDPKTSASDWFKENRVADGKLRPAADGTLTFHIDTRYAVGCTLKVELEWDGGRFETESPVTSDACPVSCKIPQPASANEVEITARLLLANSKKEISTVHVTVTIAP